MLQPLSFLVLLAAFPTPGISVDVDKMPPGITNPVSVEVSPATAEMDPARKQRLLEGQKLAALGMQYFARKDYGFAEQLLTRSLALFRDVLGEESRPCVQLLSTLGCLYSIQGNDRKAEQTLLLALNDRAGFSCNRKSLFVPTVAWPCRRGRLGAPLGD